MLQPTTTLFTPYTARSLTLKNRLVVAPMCQYSARGGVANDWHFAHLSRFAIGGFGLVIVEATAVSPEGRITYGDLGLWTDEQVQPLARIVDFLHSQGAAAGIQLAHAGRKASTPVPFRPTVEDAEKDEVGYEDWQPIAPSAIIHSERLIGFKEPRAMTLEDIQAFKANFVAAVGRAEEAGFDIVEIHAAHGYLLNQFLSPLANKRTDEYGGSRDNRMRLLLELTESVRAAWPANRPLFVRISATDNHPDGWTIDDSVVLAEKLKALGVDLVDCSSGGFDGAAFKPSALYQVPLAAELREKAGVPTMAVGLIADPEEAEAIVEHGEADLVALARPALDDPQWPLHAKHALFPQDDSYAAWPSQAGYAIRNMDRSLKQRAFSE
ncbi:NADH:flavin oxidoreductase/NADH oxidase [Rhizobium sp. KVB221]|uniref:NADH:flavin oxidoreductase/NADH oxidase n=2 Tax=Rhizobium setariae TaxID=2801340 RepID=A0A936YSP0_9HYPH|nr:NADH:flavin oxidoreductase/NADH oxidase [Rhizobium setariae]